MSTVSPGLRVVNEVGWFILMAVAGTYFILKGSIPVNECKGLSRWRSYPGTDELGADIGGVLLNHERLGRELVEHTTGVVEQLQGFISGVLEGRDDLQVGHIGDLLVPYDIQ
jgi:hypothetical protein